MLAKTKYMYDVRGTGGESRVKMWVTVARKDGPTTICTGWLVRYPEAARGGYAEAPAPPNVQDSGHAGPTNGTQITIGGGVKAAAPLSPFDAGIAPIVDGMVSAAMRRTALRAIRTVACFVAVTASVSRLHFDLVALKFSCAGKGRHTS